jgi:hypothetical protein
VEAGAAGNASGEEADTPAPPAKVRPARSHAASAEELAAHEVFIATLKQPMWLGDAETTANK